MPTRKTFCRVAAILKKRKMDKDTKEELIQEFISFFSAANPRFDSMRFRDACS